MGKKKKAMIVASAASRFMTISAKRKSKAAEVAKIEHQEKSHLLLLITELKNDLLEERSVSECLRQEITVLKSENTILILEKKMSSTTTRTTKEEEDKNKQHQNDQHGSGNKSENGDNSTTEYEIIGEDARNNNSNSNNSEDELLLKILEGHSAKVLSGCFSPPIKCKNDTEGEEGRIVFVATTSDDNTARIWDAHTGKLLQILIGHSDSVISCSFSTPTDSNDNIFLITGSADSTARIWDVQTGTLLTTLEGHSGDVSICSFSVPPPHHENKNENGRNNNIVFTGSTNEGTVRLWDITNSSGKLLNTFDNYSGDENSCSFSPPASSTANNNSIVLLIGCDDGTARIYDIQNGYKMIKTFTCPNVKCCSFSPNGKIVLTGSYDKNVYLWDRLSGELLNTITPPPALPSEFISGCCFSPTATPDYDQNSNNQNSIVVLIATFDDMVRVWDVNVGSTSNTDSSSNCESLSSFQGKVYALPKDCCFSPTDGKVILTTGGDDNARLWDVQSGRLLKTYEGHVQLLNSGCFSSNGTIILTTSDDKTARLWKIPVQYCTNIE